MRNNTSYASGMTLIELAVAMLVIALVFAGVYGMSSQVANMMSQARGETRAIEAALLEIERLRSLSWNTITGLGSTYSIVAGDNPAISDVPQGVGSVEISAYPAADPTPTVLYIQVNIGWQDAAGNTRTNRLSTLIAEKGLNP